MKPSTHMTLKRKERLSLAAFEANHSIQPQSDQLLGQVLGDCHDDNDTHSGNGPRRSSPHPHHDHLHIE